MAPTTRAGLFASFTMAIAILILLVLILALGDVVAAIPMAVRVAVMICVAWATFDWHSVRLSTLKRMPRSETGVMLTTAGVKEPRDPHSRGAPSPPG